jgi:hypothetical protein
MGLLRRYAPRNDVAPDFYETIKLDGLVKSPSAALRFNFVVAAHS